MQVARKLFRKPFEKIAIVWHMLTAIGNLVQQIIYNLLFLPFGGKGMENIQLAKRPGSGSVFQAAPRHPGGEIDGIRGPADLILKEMGEAKIWQTFHWFVVGESLHGSGVRELLPQLAIRKAWR